MDYELSAHVKREMVRRDISSDIIELVLQEPEQKVPEHGNVICYQSRIKINRQYYLVRVTVNELRTPLTVVTVYKTSKISKYWKVEP